MVDDGGKVTTWDKVGQVLVRHRHRSHGPLWLLIAAAAVLLALTGRRLLRRRAGTAS